METKMDTKLSPEAASMKQRKVSANTRNPHGSSCTAPRDAKYLSKLRSESERIFEQWKSAEGCPISQYVGCEGRYCVKLEDRGADANGRIAEFPISDIRIWGPKQFQPGFNDQYMRLEFFFDGVFDYDNIELRDRFTAEIQRIVDENFYEGMRQEFKERLQARKEMNKGKPQYCSDKKNSNDSKKDEDKINNDPKRDLEMVEMGRDLEDLEGGGFDDLEVCAGSNSDSNGKSTGTNGSEWEDFLHQPAVSSKVNVEAYREAGCMIQFVVARTCINIKVGRIIGQQAFPDYFAGASKRYFLEDEKPPPRWVYVLWGMTAMLILLIGMSIWKVFFIDREFNGLGNNLNNLTNGMEPIESRSTVPGTGATVATGTVDGKTARSSQNAQAGTVKTEMAEAAGIAETVSVRTAESTEEAGRPGAGRATGSIPGQEAGSIPAGASQTIAEADNPPVEDEPLI